MSEANENKNPSPTDRRGSKRAAGTEVGDALKSVYDRALKEQIPPEMLDLLGKLD